jgi:hypothetical protein
MCPIALRQEKILSASARRQDQNSQVRPLNESKRKVITPVHQSGRYSLMPLTTPLPTKAGSPCAEKLMARNANETHRRVRRSLWRTVPGDPTLADYAGCCFDHPDVQRALDNACEAKFIHRDLLPWPKTPLGEFKRPGAVAGRIMKKRSNALRELAKR